ncbi:two-component system regulatory protein YycI [Lysinibacillus sp. LZ02]|uniref:two-component system regulatory protein YycI n=1 Tax=Lysinibacillus sp. LZ02 TaxID=3420668 RepID=UPI003D36DF76
MDWNKTKSIFIGVFLILNIFLYSQYLKAYSEAQKVQPLGQNDIEERLKEEGITYAGLPNNIEKAPYISAKVKTYSLDELPTNNNQQYQLISDSELVVTFKEPIKLISTKQPTTLKDFVRQYVYEGTSFELWEINEELRTATFSQRFNEYTLYYNKYSKNGYVKIHWNANGEVFMYEQSMLEKVEVIEQQKVILSPLQILRVLYTKNLLKTDSHIASMRLGYSTLMQLTQTQVFTPTWEVRVRTAEGEEEQYFVNAIQGKVIEFKPDIEEVVEE